MRRKMRDITGEKFGNWTVLSFDKKKYKGLSYWFCQCNCKFATIHSIHGWALIDGRTSQCLRCLKTTHGFSYTHIYDVWTAMFKRCYNPNHKAYKNYGGKGITVCERWHGEHGFENFYADMGEKPDGKSLDRYPNKTGNYEPNNCRWGTPKEQARNRTNNKLITYNEKTQCLAAWAEELGLSRILIGDRLEDGWSIEKALTTKPKKQNQRKQLFTINGETKKLADWAKIYSIDISIVYQRIHTWEWPILKALTTPSRKSKKLNNT